MKPPTIDAQFHRMNGLQRSTESFRYVVLSFEWWISPGGETRKWIKTNAQFAVFLTAPTFLVFPIATSALWELSSCANALTAITAKLVFLPVLALLAVVSISLVCRVLKR